MFILPPNSFQVFTLKHPSALDGHTHSTAPTHTVPKHTGPSGHSFIPWVGTPHVCAPHTVPLTTVDFCGHAHTCICLLSIVINSASTQCLWATTIHPPPVFPPLHHQSVVAHTTCSTVAWGVLCTVVW